MIITIECLEAYLKLKHEADDLRARLDALGSPSGIRYSPLPYSETNEVQTLDDVIIKRERIRHKWKEKLAEAEDQLLAIEYWMDEVKEPEIQTAIRLKYIDGLTWEEVGMFLHCDRSGIARKVKEYVNSQSR